MSRLQHWLIAARFDSSLGLMREPSGSAPQMKLLAARTVANPYGMAILTMSDEADFDGAARAVKGS